MFVVGIDGCRDGWIAVALDNGRFAGASRYASFREVVNTAEDAAAIGVNIPIGLLDVGERYCDALTRELIASQRECVPLTPPREVIEAFSYEEAQACSKAVWDGEVSRNIYDLRAKILEVDAIVRGEADTPSQRHAESEERQHPARMILDKKETRESLLRYARIIDRHHGATTKPAVLVPDMRAPRASLTQQGSMPGGRIIEVRSEASFRELAGKPLELPSSDHNGMVMRLRLLETKGVVIPAELGGVGGVGAADAIDAAAVAWSTNRYAQGGARSLPPHSMWQHDGERVVAIWI
jgi:predicted RNase H-like nuclease